MATIKENKGKGVVGNKIKEEAINQSYPLTSSIVKLVPLVLSEWKNVSKRVDTGNLLSCQRNKKQKVDPLMTSTPPVMVLDHPTPVAKPKAYISPSRPRVNTSKSSESVPMTFLENEGLAWERFNQTVTNEDVAVCYDMSMKEFERSTIHDLFKVT